MRTSALVLLMSLTLSTIASGQTSTTQVAITNLTQGMYFTPRLVVAHTANIDLFEPATAATNRLAWLAEAGVTSRFEWFLSNGATGPVDPQDQPDLFPGIELENTFMTFGNLVAPGATASYNFDSQQFPRLSLLTMMIPSNDAFVGLDSWPIPDVPGTYTILLNAYDAGTEANDEINGGRDDVIELGQTSCENDPNTGEPLPNNGLSISCLDSYGDPGVAGSGASAAVGVGGTGVAIQITNGELANVTDTTALIHIHRGVLGDTEPNGGVSDLDSRVHRWLNPVARITVTVE